MKKKILIALIVFCVIIAFWYYSPKKINKTIDGFSYQLGNEEIGESVDIKINGKQRYTFTGTRIFKGKIDIEGQEIPVPSQERELELKFEIGNSSPMFYFYITKENGDSKPETFYFGQINTNKDLSQLTIRKSDEDGTWTGSEGLMITAPAKNRKEAIELSDKLIEEYQLNGDTFVKAK